MLEAVCYVIALVVGLAMVRPMQHKPRKPGTYEMLRRLTGPWTKAELVEMYKHR